MNARIYRVNNLHSNVWIKFVRKKSPHNKSLKIASLFIFANFPITGTNTVVLKTNKLAREERKLFTFLNSNDSASECWQQISRGANIENGSCALDMHGKKETRIYRMRERVIFVHYYLSSCRSPAMWKFLNLTFNFVRPYALFYTY